mgnify:CR=1 FL=1
MFSNKKPFLFLLVFALLLAACAPAAARTEDTMNKQPTEAMMKEDNMMTDATATADAMIMEEDKMMKETPTTEYMSGDEAMMETPAYFSASLTNVASGASFTIRDLKGKVILVETLAQWCPNCLKQQGQVVELHQLLGEREDFVSLGLDIDPNEDAASLKSYIEANGFSWTYAVAPAEVSNEIANLYGDQFLNPPSTPMFIIDRHGEVHLLPFGIKSAQDLLTALQPYLDDSM